MAVKITRDSLLVRWRAALSPGILLKGPSKPHLLTLTLSSKEVTATQRVSGAYGEKLII